MSASQTPTFITSESSHIFLIMRLIHANDRTQQLMGNISVIRSIPSYPFVHYGVAHAGHFKTRMSKGRSTAILKGYLCVFICMVTKTVHLRLVSDLYFEAFLTKFRRFTARIGLYFKIYNDHGSNPVGIGKQLHKEMQQKIEAARVAGMSAMDGIISKIFPVATPDFGKLWDAAVKSAVY